MCKACLDWSERRHHLAGAWGAALLQRLLDLGWARRVKDTRIVQFTPPGERGFQAAFETPTQASSFSGSSRTNSTLPQVDDEQRAGAGHGAELY
jgi:hypothetical protein